MTPPILVTIARICSWLIPLRYRREVLADLLEEAGRSVSSGRSLLVAGAWLASHIVRSGAAARWHGGPYEPRVIDRPDWPSLDNAAADWRMARRSLAGSLLFAAVALGTLTIAIGLSTAVFSLVSGVLLRPLPYPGSERLVRLAELRRDRVPTIPRVGGELAAGTIGLWTRQTATLDAIVPHASSGQTVGFGGVHEQVSVASVGGKFFDLLGVTPVQGRLFGPADDLSTASPVAVVSRRFWMQQLGQRSDAVGSALTIESVPHEIIGIVPPTVVLPTPEVDVWIPGRWTWPDPGERERGGRPNISISLGVIARLRPGTSLEAVRLEGQRVLRTVATADPAFFDGTVPIPELRVVPLRDDIVADTRPALHALLAGMALVLVAACASLANLLVARNRARARDLAIRFTLGATRVRLLRPLVFEQLVLVGSGTVLGGLQGWGILRGLPALVAPTLPRIAEVRFDWLALATASTAAVVTALAVGLRPSWARGDADLRTRSGSTSVETLRTVLVAGQVALAVILLVGASLIGQSLWRLLQTNPGYQPEGALTFQVALSPESRAQGLTRFHDALLDRLVRLPGVTAAGVASSLPLHAEGMRGSFQIAGVPRPTDRADFPRAQMHMISADYHRALGMRLVSGRPFDKRDDLHSGLVVLVEETLARRYFNGDAVGKRVHALGSRTWTIVGVVEPLKVGSVNGADEPILFFHNRQIGEALAFDRLSGGVVVRTDADPELLVPTVRQVVKELDASAPVFNVMPLTERLDRTFDQPRFYAVALALFAVLTLGTAVLGVYGVQAYAVEKRAAEFGLRRALGATESDIVRLVLRRALGLGLAGVLLGLPLAAAGAGLLRSLLFGVEARDVTTFIAVPVLVVAVVVAASWQPVRRALHIDPARALRSE
jgi:putative ABC transport system permease protein